MSSAAWQVDTIGGIERKREEVNALSIQYLLSMHSNSQKKITHQRCCMQWMCCKINKCFDCINMFRIYYEGVSFCCITWMYLGEELKWRIILNSIWRDKICSRIRKWKRQHRKKRRQQPAYIYIYWIVHIHGFKTMHEFQTVIAYGFQFIIKYCFTLFVCTNSVNVLLMCTFPHMRTYAHWNANYMQISIFWRSVLYA